MFDAHFFQFDVKIFVKMSVFVKIKHSRLFKNIRYRFRKKLQNVDNCRDYNEIRSHILTKIVDDNDYVSRFIF